MENKRPAWAIEKDYLKMREGRRCGGDGLVSKELARQL